MPVRVLIVDDSPFMRRQLTRALEQDPAIKVIGHASNPYEARNRIIADKPDVLTLDITMPKMNGIAFLERLMAHMPMPVIVLSGLVAEDRKLAERARSAGAAQVIAKPSANDVDAFNEHLLSLIKELCPRAARVTRRLPRIDVGQDPSGRFTKRISAENDPHLLITIGASTGGTEALREVVSQLPSSLPPVVLIQHMPANFTGSFAERLDRLSSLSVREARDGERLEPGTAYLVPGNYHLVVQRQAPGYRVALNQDPREHFQRPAVDVTFRSIASCAGAHAIGAILTGMGRDGASGLLAMRQAGAHTIGQDEASCVVYGMPKAAYDCGALCEQVPLTEIADRIILALDHKRSTR